MRPKICSWLLAGVWMLLVTACQPTVVNVASRVEIPAQYTFTGLAGNGVEIDAAHWWRSWDDPHLNELIEGALHNNLNIKAAQARVLEARALADMAHANLGPMVGVNAAVGGQIGEIRPLAAARRRTGGGIPRCCRTRARNSRRTRRRARRGSW